MRKGRILERFIDIHVRARIAALLCCLAFLPFIGRLYYLQIVNGDYFRDRSENNRLRRVYVHAPRGKILAREGQVLAQSRPSYNLELVLEDAHHVEQVLKRLSEIVLVSVDELQERLKQESSERRRYEPIVLLRDIPRDTVARVFARRHSLPGVNVTSAPVRDYLYGEFAAHSLGYLGQVSKGDLEKLRTSGYKPDDWIGKAGMERASEATLHGQRGIRSVFVNAKGVRMSEADFLPEEPGNSVTLSLDYATQLAAEAALSGRTGGVIALDPNNGEVLALTSRPGYDPNIFLSEMDSETWHEISSGHEHRMTSRALQGAYPPGSVFKIIVAAGALAEGLVSPSEKIYCGGSYRIGRSRRFSCHRASGHGALGLEEALKLSCNVFFYNLGERLGIDRIHEYASRFGLGSPTGIEALPEVSGIVPSREWKRKTYSNPEDKVWYPGETPSVSIGQGALTVTPAQLAVAFSALVNGGRVFRPRLTLSTEGSSREGEDYTSLGIPSSVLEPIRRGLFAVVNEKRGTGSRARPDDTESFTVAGKTGTAQRKQLVGSKELQKADSLAWFVGYAPSDDPKIVVAVLIEAGGHGGEGAAPVAKEVFEAYLGRGRDSTHPEELPVQMAFASE